MFSPTSFLKTIFWSDLDLSCTFLCLVSFFFSFSQDKHGCSRLVLISSSSQCSCYVKKKKKKAGQLTLLKVCLSGSGRMTGASLTFMIHGWFTDLGFNGACERAEWRKRVEMDVVQKKWDRTWFNSDVTTGMMSFFISCKSKQEALTVNTFVFLTTSIIVESIIEWSHRKAIQDLEI